MAGGTIARLSDGGARVALVCATRGQAGSAGDPPLVSRDALAAERERELRAACALLGVAAVTVLDHVDRQLADAPTEAVRTAFVAAIRAERPQVVLTFDPDGVNRHPDHVAVSRFALDAVTAAADPRWYPALGAAHRVRRVVWPSPVEPWTEWDPARLARCPGVDVVSEVRGWADRKAAALRAHRTQHPSIDHYWFAPGRPADVLAVESFRLGWGEPFPARPADDLFAGL